jgi:hypothetical protein
MKRIKGRNSQGVDDKVIRVSPRACAKWSECEVQITLQDCEQNFPHSFPQKPVGIC